MRLYLIKRVLLNNKKYQYYENIRQRRLGVGYEILTAYYVKTDIRYMNKNG